MTCPNEPLPDGWRIWRGSVPTELAQVAIDVRDHINDYEYGTIAAQVVYQGQPVAVFKSHHSWTYRNGQLITGICIPGCSLLIPSNSAKGQPGMGATQAPGTDLSVPDPAAAVYGADDLEQTNWRLVTTTGASVLLLIGVFWLAIRTAGRT